VALARRLPGIGAQPDSSRTSLSLTRLYIHVFLRELYALPHRELTLEYYTGTNGATWDFRADFPYPPQLLRAAPQCHRV